MQAGTQANQLASTIDCTGNIFSQGSKETCSLFFVCHKKGVSGKHPVRKNNTYYVCFHLKSQSQWEKELLLARAFFLQSALS